MHTSQILVKHRERVRVRRGVLWRKHNGGVHLHRHHARIVTLALSTPDLTCFCTRLVFCPQANEYSLPSLNTGLEDVKPSLSTSASSDLASSVSQSYSVVTGTTRPAPDRKGKHSCRGSGTATARLSSQLHGPAPHHRQQQIQESFSEEHSIIHLHQTFNLDSYPVK